MSRLATTRPWMRRTAAFLASLALAGCQPSNMTGPTVSSTPVATPIVVANSPASSTPTPKAIDREVSQKRQQKVRELLDAAKEAYPGRSAIVFIDLDSGSKVEIDPTERFESASLVKLVILAEMYRQFQVGNHKPEDKLTLSESQKRGGSGSLKNAKEGTQITLEDLSELMITESDNTATQMLTELLTLEKIEKSVQALGLHGTTLQRDIFDFEAIDSGRDNYITAQDAGDFLQQLARLELPGSEAMHEILERQKRNDIIGKDFATGVRVAHKTGELDSVLNDAGIVYAPRGTFILVLLSDQVGDKEAAKKVWAKLSQDLLQEYSEPTPTTSPSSTKTPS